MGSLFLKRVHAKELFMFIISLFYIDGNTSICGETNIRQILYGIDTGK
jgi:hypothetical protein